MMQKEWLAMVGNLNPQEFAEAYYPQAEALVEQANFNTGEGKFALLCALETAGFYRPLVGSDEARARLPKKLLEATGGPTLNPFLGIDEPGNEIVTYLARHHNLTKATIHLYTEESEKWTAIPDFNLSLPAPTRLVVIDALDESDGLKPEKNKFTQSFGLIVTDLSERILAGAVGSYVDDRIFVFAEGQSNLLSFLPEENVLRPLDRPKRESAAPGHRLAYSMLERKRQLIIANTRFSNDFDYRAASFGGWAVLEIISNWGQFDVLIDPWGQKVPEARIWGPAAQAAGLAVFDLVGRPINFQGKFKLIGEEESERLPLVICHQTDAERLKPYLSELAVNREKILRGEFDD